MLLRKVLRLLEIDVVKELFLDVYDVFIVLIIISIVVELTLFFAVPLRHFVNFRGHPKTTLTNFSSISTTYLPPVDIFA